MKGKPIGYVAFAERLGVALSPAQRVLCSVAFDGVNPEDLAGADRELAATIFGDVDVIPPEARDVLCCIAGGRAGKTYTLIALRCLHLAVTCDLSSLAPGEHGFGVIVAPDKKLARQALRFIKGAAKKLQAIARRITVDSVDVVEFVRPDGRTVTIEVLPATRGGSAVRARSYFFVGLDEVAFFYADDGYTVTDEAVFTAAAPRVMAGGQLCMVSTPWLESGVLYEHFLRNHPNPEVALDGDLTPGEPTDAIAAHAPTLLLNDRPKIRRIVEREERRNPTNAEREFGARFVARGTGRWFDATAIKLSAVDRPADLAPDPRYPCVAALDNGFTSDATSLVVTRRERGKLRVATIVEKRAEKGVPLNPSETICELLDIAKTHGATVVYSDVHYYESVLEHARPRGMRVKKAPGGNAGKVEVHIAARDALAEGRCEYAREPSTLRSQLGNIVARPISGGGMSITSPRRRGSHGDVASAWVLAIYGLEKVKTRRVGPRRPIRRNPRLYGDGLPHPGEDPFANLRNQATGRPERNERTTIHEQFTRGIF